MRVTPTSNIGARDNEQVLYDFMRRLEGKSEKVQNAPSAFQHVQRHNVHKVLLSPLILAAAETAWSFWRNYSGKSIVKEIFEGEMLIRKISTIFLQIFCKFILN